MPTNVMEVLGALAAGSDEDLVGLEESRWFDAKSQPYRLEQASQKWELAKDTSAMANGGGGLLLVAAKTEKPETYLEERITKVSPVPEGMVDVQQYLDTIQAWTFPSIAHRVHPHLFHRPDDKLLLALEIPAIDPDELPILVRTLARLGDDEVWAWAMARRVGAGTEWVNVAQIWADIRDGRLARRHLTLPPLGHTALPSTEDRIVAASNALMELTAVEGQAVLSYVALPPTGTGRLEPFYSDDGIRRILETLPRFSLRNAGFGLGYGLDVAPIDDGLVDIEEARRGLMVRTDGTLVAVAAANRDFLGWADRSAIPPRPDGKERLRLNPYVLAEYSLEFARFLREIIMERLGTHGWTLGVVGRRLKSGEPAPYLPTSVNQLSLSGREGLIDNGFQYFAASGDPERDAFELLRRFEEWFGVPRDQVLFSTEGRITAETVMSWK